MAFRGRRTTRGKRPARRVFNSRSVQPKSKRGSVRRTSSGKPAVKRVGWTKRSSVGRGASMKRSGKTLNVIVQSPGKSREVRKDSRVSSKTINPRFF